ncbi:MAG: Addiction module component, CHP02574 [Planctomycetota bacterium]
MRSRVTTNFDVTNLRDLPVADKLRIVTELWDDVAVSTEPAVVPSDVLLEAIRRSARLKAEPSMVIDNDERWRRVDG